MISEEIIPSEPFKEDEIELEKEDELDEERTFINQIQEEYLNEIQEATEGREVLEPEEIVEPPPPIAIKEKVQTTIGKTSEGQRNQLEKLLQEFGNVFAAEGELERTDLYKHKIYTEDVPPIHQKAFRMSIAEDKIIKAEIDKGLEMGLIQPSKSPWASPVVLVKKKNGKMRFYVDYQKLNSVTKEDKYPLPLIDEIIDYLGGSQWFFTMDLASGY